MKLDHETLMKIANTPIWQGKGNDGQTFADAYEYLSANGWFWKDGEPPSSQEGMNVRLAEVLQNLIDVVAAHKKD